MIPRALAWTQQISMHQPTEWYEDRSLDQAARYLGHAELGEGWLLLFDLRKEVSWTDTSSHVLARAAKR